LQSQQPRHNQSLGQRHQHISPSLLLLRLPARRRLNPSFVRRSINLSPGLQSRGRLLLSQSLNRRSLVNRRSFVSQRYVHK
jgi:hypothetical protein